MNRQKIEETANLFEVDPVWAINTRLAFLYQTLSDVQVYYHEINQKRSAEKGIVEIRLYSSILDRLAKQTKGIQYSINYLQNNQQPASGVSEGLIRDARDYPIERLVDVGRGGKIRCPFHDDKTPSASIKNNRLRCFGACGRSWSSIDFVMERDGLTFIDAVKLLTGK
jgi:hypothetical protein